VIRLWALALALACPALASAVPPLAAPPVGADQPNDDQRILVMLKLSPAHYRSSGDYGGGYDDALAQSARHRLAARIARQLGLSLLDSWAMPLIGIDCVVMQVADDRSPEEVAAAATRLPGVAWSQPMHRYELQGGGNATHNDRLFPAQPSARLWHLNSLHRMSTGVGVRVMVIDSRIDSTHPDLVGQIAAERDFVGDRLKAAEEHGTGVAGIIAARADNRVGIAGIAPDAHIIGLRACSQSLGNGTTTMCDSLSLAKALTFAVQNKARIINMSLSGPADRLLAILIQMSLARGGSVVAAVDPRRADGGFPASVPGVIAVADEWVTGNPTGAYIAPGVDIPTTEPGGRWNMVSGNSFAAAHVSGLLALMRQLAPNQDGRRSLVTFGGRGVIDACTTLARVSRSAEASCSMSR
jgi:subtilisin family serine protease